MSFHYTTDAVNSYGSEGTSYRAVNIDQLVLTHLVLTMSDTPATVLGNMYIILHATECSPALLNTCTSLLHHWLVKLLFPE